MELEKQAAPLLLHKSDVDRQVCVMAGTDVNGNLDISRERFAPDVIDSILQDMTKSMNFKHADQEMDTYLMESDMSRQKAEARMIMGSGFPDEFASVSRMQHAALAKNGKTLVLASLGTTLAFPQVSAQMRRLFGPCG